MTIKEQAYRATGWWGWVASSLIHWLNQMTLKMGLNPKPGNCNPVLFALHLTVPPLVKLPFSIQVATIFFYFSKVHIFLEAKLIAYIILSFTGNSKAETPRCHPGEYSSYPSSNGWRTQIRKQTIKELTNKSRAYSKKTKGRSILLLLKLIVVLNVHVCTGFRDWFNLWVLVTDSQLFIVYLFSFLMIIQYS